jgi:hypothetical protein
LEKQVSFFALFFFSSNTVGAIMDELREHYGLYFEATDGKTETSKDILRYATLVPEEKRKNVGQPIDEIMLEHLGTLIGVRILVNSSLNWFVIHQRY